MEIFFTILIMTLVVSLSGVVTRVMPFQIPLPLMQIAIGALLAWPTFGLHVEFDPELFLVLFIPPLLFADGWKTPTREFLEHGREIFGLALALVVVTVVGIGFLIYWVVPGIPLIPAFALAAVLSPTDADGNIFSIMGDASTLLKKNKQTAEAKEMCKRVLESGDYYKALLIISEYVETELSPPPKENKKAKKKHQPER